MVYGIQWDQIARFFHQQLAVTTKKFCLIRSWNYDNNQIYPPPKKWPKTYQILPNLVTPSRMKLDETRIFFWRSRTTRTGPRPPTRTLPPPQPQQQQRWQRRQKFSQNFRLTEQRLAEVHHRRCQICLRWGRLNHLEGRCRLRPSRRQVSETYKSIR